MAESIFPARHKVAVTGGSGFVARRLLHILADKGVATVALSRHPLAPRRGQQNITLNDYLDAALLEDALAGVGVIVHLAGRAHQDFHGQGDSETFHAANVETTIAVARAALAARVRRIVFVSSIGVHGSRSDQEQPFTEHAALAPETPYAVSKVEAESALIALASGTLEHTILRPPLVYGPGAPGNFAQLLALVKRLPRVPLGGLHRLRSLIHIDNLCSAIELALVHPQAAGRTFVLCDGEDLSVADIARELAAGLGRDPRCVIDLPEAVLRFAGTLLGRGAAVAKLADELRVDASAFRAATGWHPPRGAREALRETAAASLAPSPHKAAHA